MTDTATQKGADNATPDTPGALNVQLDEDGAAEAFLTAWENEDPAEASSEGEEQDGDQGEADETTGSAQGSESDPDDEGEEGSEDPDAEADDGEGDDSGEDDGEEEGGEQADPKAADDDAVVTFKVDGEERQVPVRDLKRLAGQEAALTRKSQEVAAQRKAAETKQQEHAVALTALLERAKQRFEPYTKVDMIAASHQLGDKDFQQLRADAQAAEAEVKFLEEEIGGLVEKMREQQGEALKEQAKAAVATLTDPTSALHIPDWGNELYDSIRGFAVSLGFDAEAIAKETNPVALKALHMAMLYQQGQKKVATKKRVKVSPKKVLKTQGSKPQSRSGNRDAALEKARKSGGEEDDIANAFLAGWKQ